MKTLIIASAMLFSIATFTSCGKKGCTDSSATNYCSKCKNDDGSCQYKKKGCTDPISINYDSQAEVDDGTCQYAGTGGNTSIVAKPKHHGVPIISTIGYVDSAFVKFNTQQFPGFSASFYDLVLAGTVGEDHVTIAGMKPGKYYIFMTGYDTTINLKVVGGIPFTLTQTSGLIDLVVPVTE